MITVKDRKKLKHIPHRNSGLIQEILKELGYPVFSKPNIANVLRGNHENLQIEEAIYILNQRIDDQKKRIKKPKAATSGSL